MKKLIIAIFLLMFLAEGFSQKLDPRVVYGRVSDIHGNPISGVRVYVPLETAEAWTGEDGVYRLALYEERVVIISYSHPSYVSRSFLSDPNKGARRNVILVARDVDFQIDAKANTNHIYQIPQRKKEDHLIYGQNVRSLFWGSAERNVVADFLPLRQIGIAGYQDAFVQGYTPLEQRYILHDMPLMFTPFHYGYNRPAWDLAISESVSMTKNGFSQPLPMYGVADMIVKGHDKMHSESYLMGRLDNRNVGLSGFTPIALNSSTISVSADKSLDEYSTSYLLDLFDNSLSVKPSYYNANVTGTLFFKPLTSVSYNFHMSNDDITLRDTEKDLLLSQYKKNVFSGGIGFVINPRLNRQVYGLLSMNSSSNFAHKNLESINVTTPIEDGHTIQTFSFTSGIRFFISNIFTMGGDLFAQTTQMSYEDQASQASQLTVYGVNGYIEVKGSVFTTMISNKLAIAPLDKTQVLVQPNINVIYEPTQGWVFSAKAAIFNVVLAMVQKKLYDVPVPIYFPVENRQNTLPRQVFSLETTRNFNNRFEINVIGTLQSADILAYQNPYKIEKFEFQTPSSNLLTARFSEVRQSVEIWLHKMKGRFTYWGGYAWNQMTNIYSQDSYTEPFIRRFDFYFAGNYTLQHRANRKNIISASLLYGYGNFFIEEERIANQWGGYANSSPQIYDGNVAYPYNLNYKLSYRIERYHYRYQLNWIFSIESLLHNRFSPYYLIEQYSQDLFPIMPKVGVEILLFR